AVARGAQRNCQPDAARCAGDEQCAALERHDRSTDSFGQACVKSTFVCSECIIRPRTRCAPLPLVGRGWGWGSLLSRESRSATSTPTPPAFATRFGGRPSPQGGGEDRARSSSPFPLHLDTP